MTLRPEFGVSNFIHSAGFYDQVSQSLRDLPFYRRMCALARGAALELCCGTGRLTVPLAPAGVPIEGLDASADMLQAARRKAAVHNCPVSFHLADMRDYALGKRFALVCIPFHSLQCIYTIDDLEQVLRLVRSHLRQDGWFVFDVFHPNIDLMLRRSSTAHEVVRFVAPTGEEVVVTERCAYDAASQVNRFTWTVSQGRQESQRRLDMRCFYPLELDALLRYNGFRTIHRFGDFDETPFTATSPEQVYVCQVRSSA